MDAVRDVARQVVHPSSVSRELFTQMAVIAFALGMVFAAMVETSKADHTLWGLFFEALLAALLYLYGWTSYVWYTFLD